jgi:hypothetical protein
MIFSGDSSRKSQLGIDFNMRFLKKTATRKHGFLQAVFLRNRL